MQAEVKKQGEKPQYKGVIDAYRTIARTEGMKGLYKGMNKLEINIQLFTSKLQLLMNNHLKIIAYFRNNAQCCP